MREDDRAWLALLRVPGIGAARFAQVLAAFGSPAAAFAASRRERLAAGLPEAVADALAAPDWAGAERDLAWTERPGNHLLRGDDPAYPARLRGLDRAPPLLFVRGDPACLADPQLAIVGTRRPTPVGAGIAREFAGHLARDGLAITSGLALGIDAEAHQGALAAGGRTLAVFGTGPDRVYPARHRELAHAIVDSGGALVSELPTGTPVLAENFPRRNRIIAGLALGVLVVEAAARSGSLITARLAAEAGREVFAIPGSIHNPMARGCHALIREGATLVETAGDILYALAPQAAAALAEATATAPATAPAGPAQALPELADDYRKLLDSMGDAPIGVDLLVQRSGLTAEVVSSMLLILELEGYVASAPGGLYSKLGR